MNHIINHPQVPSIMSKLSQEDDTHGPAGGAKKGTLDVHRGGETCGPVMRFALIESSIC